MVNQPPPSGNRRLYVYGALGVGGALAYTYYKRRKNAAAASAAAADPAAYNDVVDGGYGSYSAVGTGSAVGVTPSAYGTGTPVSTAPSDNKGWASLVTTYLGGLGYDTLTVAKAIGAYLAGDAVTPEQKQIVQAALAYGGNTPQTVAPLHTTTPTGQTNETLAAPNIRVSSHPSATTSQLVWTPVPHANQYKLYKNGAAIYTGSAMGRVVPKGSGSYQIQAIDTTKKYAVSALSYAATA